MQACAGEAAARQFSGDSRHPPVIFWEFSLLLWPST